MKKLLFVLTALFWSLTSTLHAQNLCFNGLSAAGSPTTDISPAKMASADFNNDGNLDFVVLAGTTGVELLLGSNTGTFTAPISVQYYTGGTAISVLPADFNNDGIIDLAIGAQSNKIYIMTGNGTGAFGLYANYSSTAPQDLAKGDFNNDGKVDLVVVGGGPNDISMFKGNGNGSFVLPVSFTTGQSYGPTRCLVTADFNGDANLDLAISNDNHDSLCVLMGTGTASFSPLTRYPLGLSAHSMKQGDFNNDGHLDLLVSGAAAFKVMMGSAGGTFSATSTYSYNTVPLATAADAGDFNNDNFLDFAVVNFQKISIYSGHGNGTFTFERDYAAGQNPVMPLTTDINHDGKPDLSVLNSASNSYILLDFGSISNLLGIGSCKFVSSMNFSVTPSLSTLTPGDFNGDGKIDFVTTSDPPNGSNIPFSFSILSGSGTGSFSVATTYTVPHYASTAIAADFNNDGKTDICSNMNGYNLSVFLGAGNNTFAPAIISWAGTAPLKITAADINTDGNMDIAALDNYGNVSIYLGTGTGSFSAPVSYTSNSNTAVGIAAADFDGDGYTDLVIADSGLPGVRILKGLAGGTFAATTNNYPSSANINALLTGDFNADGHEDIVLSNGSYNKISVLLNSGSGAFAAAVSYTSGAYPTSVSKGDFNGDGHTDLAVANSQSTYMAVFLGSASGAFTGPVNYYAAEISQMIVSADVNNDGQTDLVTGNGTADDISVFINGISNMTLSGVSPMCQGGTAIITASGAPSYTWNTGVNTASISVSPSSTTAYTVSSTPLLAGCANFAIANVIINPSPAVTAGSSQGMICAGASVLLSAAGATSYTWSTGANTPTIAATPSVTTTYTVTGKNGGGCSGNAAVVVTVNPTPTVTVNSGAICSGDSFTMSAGGASTYTYTGGSSSVTPVVNSTYTVTGTDANGCTDNTGAVSSVTVNPTPTVTVVQNSTVCVGTSADLIASGASTYSWSNGATTPSVNITPTSSNVYTVTGTDLNNCGNTQTVSITVDNTCADVWPGDANSDGTADNMDVLELGLHYTQTGTPRAGVSNAWQSFYADNWTGAITNGQNVNHADCNGDGTIDDNDTLAIYNNYGLTHAMKPAQTFTANPQLSIVPDQSSVVLGAWGSSSIYLGDAADPVNNVNGIAFTIDFDHTLIEPSSIYLEYPVSFINAANQNLDFRKLDFNNGVIYTATTHTVSGNVSGNGKIGILHYRISTMLSQDAVLNIALSQANQSDATGSLTPLTTGSCTIAALGSATGISTVSNDRSTAVYPNPASNLLMVTSSLDLQKIELTDLTGQLVLSEAVSGRQHQVQLKDLAAGIYFISVYSDNRVIKHEKIVMQR